MHWIRSALLLVSLSISVDAFLPPQKARYSYDTVHTQLGASLASITSSLEGNFANEDDEMASLKKSLKEIETLRSQLATAPAPAPAPVVAVQEPKRMSVRDRLLMYTRQSQESKSRFLDPRDRVSPGVRIGSSLRDRLLKAQRGEYVIPASERKQQQVPQKITPYGHLSVRDRLLAAARPQHYDLKHNHATGNTVTRYKYVTKASKAGALEINSQTVGETQSQSMKVEESNNQASVAPSGGSSVASGNVWSNLNGSQRMKPLPGSGGSGFKAATSSAPTGNTPPAPVSAPPEASSVASGSVWSNLSGSQRMKPLPGSVGPGFQASSSAPAYSAPPPAVTSPATNDVWGRLAQKGNEFQEPINRESAYLRAAREIKLLREKVQNSSGVKKEMSSRLDKLEMEIKKYAS